MDRDLPSPFLLDHDSNRPIKTSFAPRRSDAKVAGLDAAPAEAPPTLREKPVLRLGNAIKSAALNLRNRDAPPEAPDTPFTALVKEACAFTRELNAASTARAARLTAKAMLRECTTVAGSTPERVAKLRKLIEANERGLEECQRRVRGMLTFLDSPNWTRAPDDPASIVWLYSPASIGELAARSYGYAELFCAAVSIAADRQPACFGTCEDSAAHTKRLEDLKAKQADLYQRISTGWVAADCLFTPLPNPPHAMLVSFALSGTAVSVAPPDSAGERLVGWMLANEKA